MKQELLIEAKDFLYTCYQNTTQKERQQIEQIPIWVEIQTAFSKKALTEHVVSSNQNLEISDDIINDICALSFLADDCWVGASKVVFHSDTLCPDLVFKIPIRRRESYYYNDNGLLELDTYNSCILDDACHEEEELYYFMDKDIRPYFLETCYVANSTELFHIPIYVSPYIKHQSPSVFWKGIQETDKIEQIKSASTDIAESLRNGEMDEEVVSALLAIAPKTIVDKIVNYIDLNCIDDVVSHNILYQKNKCYIADYAGFARLVVRYLNEEEEE